MARVAEWGRGHRRALLVGVLVLAVLALVALLVRNPVNDAWLSHRACDGELAGDELDMVRTDARLETEDRFQNEDLGQYRCYLENTDGKIVVSVNAYTRLADQRKELSSVGKGHQPQRVLPGGLPGFAGGNGDIHLMPPCPRLGKDFDGQPRRMLATTWVPLAKGEGEAAALLRMAVKMTNEASQRLGCGAEPLAAPKKDARAEKGREITRAAAKSTPCAALARDGWLTPGAKAREGQASEGKARGGEARRVDVTDAKVVDAVRAHAPIGRCTLTMGGGSSGDSRAPSRQPVVELTSWYGDWGGGAEEMGSGDGAYGLRADGARTPRSDASTAWATARCDGQYAGFAARWGYSYGDHTAELDRVRPESDGARAAALRALVAEFAKDQAERAGCSGLKLPGPE